MSDTTEKCPTCGGASHSWPSTASETQSQREARLQREAFLDGARWIIRLRAACTPSEAFAEAIHAEALRRYPDPPATEPRVEVTSLAPGYKWRCSEGAIESLQDNDNKVLRLWDSYAGEVLPAGWARHPKATTWLDFANDLRAWPLRDTISGQACRRTPNGTVEYRDVKGLRDGC